MPMACMGMEESGGLWDVWWLWQFCLPCDGMRQGGRFGPKNRIRATRAQFWVCSYQQHVGVMEGGGGLQHVQWLQWFGLPFDGARQDGRFGAKTLKLSG